MAVSLTRLPLWLWRGKDKESKSKSKSNASALNSSPDCGLGLRESENVKFPSVKGGKVATTSSRKVRRKWHSREERRIDRECDVVIVPSDGVCLSASESDDSDWSVGWLEPHGSDFQSGYETDDSFAVLVPCYKPGSKELVENPVNHFLSTMKNFTNDDSADSEKYMEQWLSSLQNC